MVSRVVIINDNLCARGGAEALAIKSAILFREKGVTVTFFTGDGGNGQEFRSRGIEVIEANNKSINNSTKVRAFTNGLYFPNSRKILAEWIARNDTLQTIYHVHAWSKVLSPSIFGALRPVSARTVLHAHDFFSICPNGGFTNYRKNVACDLVALKPRCLVSNCDKRNYAHKLWRIGRYTVGRHLFDLNIMPANHILLNHAMVPFFLRAGVPKELLHVIPNPVDFPRTTRVLAERNQKIIFIGRLDPEKGPLDVAEAARCAGADLLFIGSGPLEEQIISQYPEFRITGWLNQDEIKRHLSEARLVVVPSRWRETFGLAAVEALRLGVPVIISERALISSGICDQGAGIAIDTTNTALFTKLLRRLIIDDAIVSAMSSRAMSAAQALALSFEEWRDALLECYETVLVRHLVI